jgi:hypothetical protein
MFKIPKNFFKIFDQIGEEIILIAIIILNILDFADMLSPDLDYAKKILSWTALGYLFYKANLTQIFFGVKNKKIDLLLIISFFLLSFKNIIGYAVSTIDFFKTKSIEYWAKIIPISKIPENSNVLNIDYGINGINLTNINNFDLNIGSTDLVNQFTFVDFFNPTNLVLNITNDISNKLVIVEPNFLIHRWLNLIVENIEFVSDWSLIMGGVLLFLISLYCAFNMKVNSPSFLNVFKVSNLPTKNFNNIFFRFIIIFLCFNLFFIVVFNLVMEWLAIAIDAPLLVIALFSYIFIWIKHHKKFNTQSIIYKVGNIGNSFYENFINLFKTRNGILFAFSGMLVLHLLTEIGIFIIPHFTGIYGSLYFGQFSGEINPIFSYKDFFNSEKEGLFLIDYLLTTGLFNKFVLFYLYLANFVFIITIFLIPALFWYYLFKNKNLKFPFYFPAIFFSSFICFILSPVFNITRISSFGLVGVNIQTISLLESAIFNIIFIFLVSISIAFLMLYVAFSNSLQKKIFWVIIIIIFLYFSWYILLFFVDIFIYYLNAIYYTFINIMDYYNFIKFFVLIYFIIFFLLTIIFYLSGFISLIYISFISYKKQKKLDYLNN